MPFPEYEEFRAYISSQAVAEAYEYLVSSANDLEGITAHPYPHGYMKRNFHYFWGEISPFAFVVNREWLLFYIRKPAITKQNYDVNKLRKYFPDAKETGSGEINFKIRSLKDAQLVMEHLFGVQPSRFKMTFPDEVDERETYTEGSVERVTVNHYERDKKARNKCIEHFGCICIICGFDFEEAYGELGQGFIHVHHLKEISSVGQDYKVDPKRDLCPVCPNCHAMLHQQSPALTPDQVRENLTRRRS